MPKVAIHVYARRPYSFEPENERGQFVYSYEFCRDLDKEPSYIPSEHAYLGKYLIDVPHEVLSAKTFAMLRIDAIDKAESQHREEHYSKMRALKEERDSLLALTYQPEPKETQVYEQETVGNSDLDSDTDAGSEGGSKDNPF